MILASHLGRPKGKPNPEYSLKPVAERLSELLRPAGRVRRGLRRRRRRRRRSTRRGARRRGRPAREPALPPGRREERPGVRRSSWRELADVYVNDAFGSAHRAHASTEGIVHHVKEAAAGLLMAAEVEYLGKVLEQPGAAVRRDPRRRQGVGQARSDREPDRRASTRCSSAARWPTRSSRRAACRSASRWSKRICSTRRRDVERAGQGARPAPRAAGRSRRRAEARSRRAGRDARRRRRRRSAIGWGSTSARRRSRPIAAIIAGAKTVDLERADGRVRDRRVRQGHDRGRQGGGGRQGHDGHRRRRLDCGGRQGRRHRPDHAHLDRRRRVAGVPRRPEAARASPRC